MTRPRIRTIKPEMWQDEKIGQLDRNARLLFLVLISMADDDGRFRALPSLILGHGYPYDADALRKLAAWMDEIETAGLMRRYDVDGVTYGVLLGWKRHQKINRPTPSTLPEPSRNGHGAPMESSSPRARACAGADRIKDQDRIGSDRKRTVGGGMESIANAQAATDQDQVFVLRRTA